MALKTEIYVLAGFLGSGKTTTLAHLVGNLPDPEGTLVVVNEAGELGLDGKLVEKAGLPVRELRNGCVCCSLQAGFVALLTELFLSDPPRRILLEASGLADTGRLYKNMARFADNFAFQKTVTMLDPEIWEIREAFGDFFSDQLASSDLILLTKIDLHEKGKIDSFVSEISGEFPLAAVEPISFGRADAGTVLAPPKNSPRPTLSRGQNPYDDFKSLSYASPRPMSRAGWDEFARENCRDFERVKGQIQFPGEKRYFDYVRGRVAWLPPLDDVPGTSLVFIGREFDAEALERQLSGLCQAE
ncbi:MAG: GTP-binding protein [Deltaproteobacteria bacterium]|jgi:G3E family GTPase|nr:GTP-binding protein [Deltaproteobacteria bacterium]